MATFLDLLMNHCPLAYSHFMLFAAARYVGGGPFQDSSIGKIWDFLTTKHSNYSE